MTEPGRAVILVVDDEPGIADLLAEVLREPGLEVMTAGHGRAALDLLAEHPVDLVISDVLMPVLDGLGLYREATRRFPHLRRRFIWITGEVPDREMREFLHATGAPLVPKPFTLETVRHTVRRVLEAP